MTEQGSLLDIGASQVTFDERARVARLEMATRQAWSGVVIALGVLALLCFGLWDVADRRHLVAWLAISGVVTILRLVAIIGFQRRNREAGTAVWERWFTGTLVMASLVWGVGGWLVMSTVPRFHQAMIFLFLVGMAGGTAALYSAQRLGATLAVFGFLIPSALWAALQPDVQLRVIAIAAFILAVASARAIGFLAAFIRRTFELSNEVEMARQEAERLARTDDLTGLLNRRAFHEVGGYLIAQARRHERPIAMLLVDVDLLKEINDNHGHVAGDAALQTIAEVLRRSGRRIDVVGRIGGDEFTVLMPDSTAEAASTLAERIRAGVSELSVTHEGTEIPLTCSIGVASGDAVESLEQLLRRADQALYGAKDAGRDRVTSS